MLEVFRPGIEQTFLNEMINEQTFYELRFQMVKYTIFGLLISVLLCILPSQAIDRLSVRTVLLGIFEKGGKQRGRSVLLFIQMLILLVFMSTAIVLKLQTDTVRRHMFSNLSPDEQQNIIMIPCSYKQLADKKDILMANIAQSAVVKDVTYSVTTLSNYGFLDAYDLNIDGLLEKTAIRKYEVSSDFCDFFNGQMLVGNFFDDLSDPQSVVVDETFAALYPEGNPIGKIFDNYRIIGIIKNIQMVAESDQSGTQQKRPVFYSRSDSDKLGYYILYVKAIPEKAEEARKHALTCIHEFIPDNFELYENDFYRALNENFEMERTIMTSLSVVFVLCLVVSLLSMYSSVAMNTEKRRKEIAIRKVNGADIIDIIRLFSKTYIRLWSIVCIIIFPVVFFVARQRIASFSQQMSLNAFFFLGLYLSILALIMLTIVFQIIKVARQNPAEVVKSE